jgi:rare lipoprotein A
MRWGVVVALGLAGALAGCSAARKPKPVPVVAESGTTQTGIASWYGPGFHGRRTSSGEIYNQFDLTAAHQTLPHGTRVRVTNLTNGRTVQVRINDRGPFVDDRIIDLSYAAARQIDMIGPGTAPVRMEVVGSDWSDPVQVAAAAPPSVIAVAPVQVAAAAPPSVVAVAPVQVAAAAPPSVVAVAPAPIVPLPVSRPAPPRPEAAVAAFPVASSYAVQIAAFTDYDRARRAQRDLETRGAPAHLGMVEEGTLRYYRLRVGPYSQREQATRVARQIAELGFPALVVAAGPSR